jgi:transposase
VCGCVSKENRQCQEEFKCINCSHADNADHNSSLNIFNRFHLDVLRGQLLFKDKLGQFRPRKLKKEVIKQSIESYCFLGLNNYEKGGQRR